MKKLICFFAFLISFLGISQQTEYVDFISATADVYFTDVSKNEVMGCVTYKFQILKDIDSVYLDAKGFKSVKYILDKKHTDSTYTEAHIVLRQEFKAGAKHELFITWEASPRKALYFIDWNFDKGNKQIWTQGQGKYTSNWFPSLDDMNEKVEFDLRLYFDPNYQVIANGKLIEREMEGKYLKWHYDMQNPMPSYLLALAIGKYDKKVAFSESGIPLEMYYYPEDSAKFEPTYRYTKKMFDFLEEEIGVPYPWQNYKMVPVKDFLYAGMENTSLNIYSDAFVVDSTAFVDRNFVNINAHELAHQWFGDMVTATSGTHHWLQEGFATYYALLAEKDIFGEEYYYWRLYEYAQELLAQDKAGQSTSLLNPKSSSTTFYKKGCWALHVLREKIGNDAFRSAVKNYLSEHQFKNVETKDFLKEVELVTDLNIGAFVKVWLYGKKLPYHEIEAFFKLTSVDYKGFLQLDCKQNGTACPDFVMNNKNNDLRAEVARKCNCELDSVLEQMENIKVRQAIAHSLSEIPLAIKKDYESLLNDKSYITVEAALFNLWRNFPEERASYLNQTKDVIGFNDKNVRTLWLTLALITKDYEPENKPKYFQELTDYTSPKYGFEIRQRAFQYLTEIQACDEDCKMHLKQATSHHNWRFKKFAKSLLEKE